MTRRVFTDEERARFYAEQAVSDAKRAALNGKFEDGCKVTFIDEKGIRREGTVDGTYRSTETTYLPIVCYHPDDDKSDGERTYLADAEFDKVQRV